MLDFAPLSFCRRAMNDLLPFTGTDGVDAASMCCWKTKVSVVTNHTKRPAPSPYSSGTRAAYIAQLFGLKQAREVVKQVVPDDRIHRMEKVRARLDEKKKVGEDVANMRDAIRRACQSELSDLKLPISTTLSRLDRKNFLNPRADAVAETQNRSYEELSANFTEYL